MKSTRARLLAALAVTFTLAAPAFLASRAEALVSPADRCRANLVKGSRGYLDRVFTARKQCQDRIIDGLIPAATNCVTGRGDSILDLRLRKAEYRLSRVGAACTGVNLLFLGFPGSCTDYTGAPFDTADFQRCILEETGDILAELLDVYYPPISGFVLGNAATCLKGTPFDAGRSFVETLRARETCALAQEYDKLDDAVLCRNEILPYGPGTGDERVDQTIANGYLYLLNAIPTACVDVDVNTMGYVPGCPDATGAPFTIYDLKQCLFNLNGLYVLEAMSLVFPTDPVCGDGNVSAPEECDLGSGNSDTKPNTCRTDCTNPRCHDGVVDSGEQCDDGNTVDGDCCSGNCVNDICGDGQKTCTEECDNGAANDNDTPFACRENCKNPRCGDGTRDGTDEPPTGEQCDDGDTQNEDGCSQFCLDEFCGDEIVQAGLGEVCDNGVDNSDTEPDACRTNCLPPDCGDNVTDTGEDCDDGNKNDGDACPANCAICGNNEKAPLEECDGTDVESCDPGDGCTSTCTCEPACPGSGELVLYSGVGDACATNADCPVGTCDDTDGRCRTITRLDSGWTGLAHLADINNNTRSRGLIECEGHGPTCGQCNVVGVDPSTGSCRCASNTRQTCDDPFGPASDECPICSQGDRKGFSCTANTDCAGSVCGRRCSNSPFAICTTNTDCGATGTCAASATTCLSAGACTTNADCSGSCTAQANCDCYFGAPFPLSSSGTPACVVNRFSKPISGTANVDLGAGEITANLATQVFLGLGTRNPCPTCGGLCTNLVTTTCDRNQDCSQGDFCDGDPVLNDGNKQGTCMRQCDLDADCGASRTCQLDPVPEDGVRGGRCRNGRNALATCDAMANNTSFPAFSTETSPVSGGYYSLDCLPDVGKNISGAGLVINLKQTTGTVSLPSTMTCSAQLPGELCPCLACTTNLNVGCNSNADCLEALGCAKFTAQNPGCNTNADCVGISVGRCGLGNVCANASGIPCTTNADCSSVDAGPCNPGTCTTKGVPQAVFPAPNQCEGLQCSSEGDGTGKCTTGPDASYCDGVVKANGTGILGCNDDDGCSFSATGVSPNAGLCTLVERQSCFPDPVVATGDPDPSTPVGAAVFCVPATGSEGINAVAGLPGPGRVVNQSKARTFCEKDPTRQYIPGVGGCLD